MKGRTVLCLVFLFFSTCHVFRWLNITARTSVCSQSSSFSSKDDGDDDYQYTAYLLLSLPTNYHNTQQLSTKYQQPWTLKTIGTKKNSTRTMWETTATKTTKTFWTSTPSTTITHHHQPTHPQPHAMESS